MCVCLCVCVYIRQCLCVCIHTAEAKQDTGWLTNWIVKSGYCISLGLILLHTHMYI